MARSNNSNCSFLPEGLVFKILTILPVLSLLRCKSVCKSWLSIILNPQFIQTHLIQSLKKQPSDVLKVVDNYIYTDTSVHVLPFFIEIVCSCNGLVCACDRNGDVIYLGNPMTKQFKQLPPPRKRLYLKEFILRFGFDDISNDYKILRVAYKFSHRLDVALQAELYSANDDSWKEIQVPERLEDFPIFRNTCVHLKGSRVLYLEGRHELLSFDLHDEVFRVYPYPISPLQFEQRKSFVLDFEGSVAMVFSEYVNDELVLSLWTLNDVLGNWSWTKEFNLDDSLKEIAVISLYLGDGQFLACNAGEFFFYDYTKKHGQKFLPPPYPRRTCSIVKFNESLVSLEGFKQQ